MAKVVKKAKEVIQEVEQEVIVPAEVEQEDAVDLAPADDFVSGVEPIYSDDFAYEIKAGKGTFPAMSDEDVVDFVVATLGKVDKIVITKL